MKRRWLATAAIALASVVAPPVAPSPVGAKSSDALVWYRKAPLRVYTWGSDRCTFTVGVGATEQRRSGVTRLRARFEIRTTWDPGYLPARAKGNWLVSRPFTDDSKSYTWVWYRRKGDHTFGDGKTVTVWVKVVGERPSFWQPDLTLRGRVGEISCDRSDPTEEPGTPIDAGM